MAANETKDSKDVVEKLKELEASLAKELDQKIRLAEPSDPRLEGTVDVNPNMAQALQKAKDQAQAHNLVAPGPVPAPAATPSSGAPTAGATPGAPPSADQVMAQEPDVENMTVKDVDELLNQLDSGFQSSMEEIKNEIGKVESIPNFESISIGTDFLKEAETKESEPEDPEELMTSDDIEDIVESDIKKWEKQTSLTRVAARFLWATCLIPPRVIGAIFNQRNVIRAQPPKETLLWLSQLLKEEGRLWLEKAKALYAKITGYPRRVYALFGLILLILASLVYLSRDIVVNFHGDTEKDPFLRDLFGVADSVQAVPDESDSEDLESPLRHPEYTVLVHRIVANLKATSPDEAPMVALELYIEASNQEAAIEIHNRDSEVRDIIERVLEQTTFGEIDTPQGKNRLKIRIRNGLDRILNKGTAKHIYFKNLNFAE